MPSISIRRLGPDDVDQARRTFALMADVFENPRQPLSDAYLQRLLSRTDFWALAAFAGDTLAGGLTAHTLPMTTSENSAVFLYDIAVDPAYQRQGIGRQLVAALREMTGREVFVFADNEDAHALDFYRALGGVPLESTMFTFEPA